VFEGRWSSKNKIGVLVELNVIYTHF
jgi:hypothetical protein